MVRRIVVAALSLAFVLGLMTGCAPQKTITLPPGSAAHCSVETK